VRRLIWTAYLVMLPEGFLIYAVGFITPFVQTTLHVEPWVASLPNSLMAVGMGVGGAAARGMNARFGAERAIRAWLLVMAGSAVLLAAPVHILATIAGGVLFGAAAGAWLVHANSALGPLARGGLILTRANLASVAGSLVGPLVLSMAAASVGWWFGILVPLPLLVVMAFITPGSPARDRTVGPPGAAEPPLSREFWLAWLFLALCIGAEFSYVVWGAQIVSTRTGITTESATGLATAFVAGMVGGRLMASIVHLGPRRQLIALRLGAALTLVGALVTWAAVFPVVDAIGLFLGGLGMSTIYPYGAALALGHAPDAPVRASSRLTLASSVSIFSAPLVLGLVAGTAGIVGAWAIVVVLLALALALVLRVGVPATVVDHADVLAG